MTTKQEQANSARIEKLRAAEFMTGYECEAAGVSLRIYRTRTSGTYGKQYGAILFMRSGTFAWGWTGGCGYNKEAAVVADLFSFACNEVAEPRATLCEKAISLASSGRIKSALASFLAASCALDGAFETPDLIAQSEGFYYHNTVVSNG
jgi:hypothetical protein